MPRRWSGSGSRSCSARPDSSAGCRCCSSSRCSCGWAAAEASVAQMRSAISGLPVRRAMIRDFVTVAPTDPLRAAADRVVRGYQADFPVVEGDKVVGVLTLQELLAGLSQTGLDTPVSDVMRTD